MKQRLVVIGAGMASGRFLEHLFEVAPDKYSVTLFGAEPRGNYNRIMLSPVLSGEKQYKDIITHDADWYASHGVECCFGESVTSIDRARKCVLTAEGEVPYDKILIATGSDPFVIPVPGHDLPGVITYRDLDDTNAMIAAAEKSRPQGKGKALVIGGGLLGLEAAAGLQVRGMDVTVLHLNDHLMDRQLDFAAGYLLQTALEQRGIRVHVGANTQAILGADQATGVRLDDGTEYAADIVVMAVGIRPNITLAKSAGLACGRGVHVDDAMVTSDEHIFAIGECVEHRSVCYGLVAPLYDMARVAAQTLVGETAAYTGSTTSTKLKVTGIDLFSGGDFAEGEGREEIVYRDPSAGIYKRLVIADNKIVGIVLYGDTADGSWFFGLLKDATDISAMRDTLIFGPSYAGGVSADPLAAVAALPDEAEICGCNGVCKSQITSAIAAGANDVNAVRSTTKASSSCGTCTGLVEQLLAFSLGDDFEVQTASPMCACTDLTHEEVRRLIKAQQLKSMPAVMQACGWKTSCGCHSCRPALNYYLLSDWPLEYQDDPQSRFVNERHHANIQKDGTFSVVPRMWGGITTPDELRAIADAADKFKVPTVKVTGGQRIDLLGVQKQDLPEIWFDLNAAGLVSGHAYAKGLRTVKTCVGTEHCRFGTQDSTGLGIQIEQRLWGSWTPHKVKLAVSGCPRNCAEATCKDVGVICVDSGYEIGVGGAAGMDVKATEPLCKVATETEAMDMIVAFVQLYREHGKYLDRPYKWVAKVGMDWVREQVVADTDKRVQLIERFNLSQATYQKDPWAHEASAKQRHVYSPMQAKDLEAVS